MQSESGPTSSGHVIVCGLHDEGLRVVEELQRVGVAVVVVDDDPDSRLVYPLEQLGVRLIRADPREQTTLEQAGLAEAAALVCVEGDDLHTMATALLARELSPHLRVVIQLSNAAVGRALGDVGIAVLDVAALTAPSVVDACLRTGRRELDLARHYTVVEVEARQAGTLRELYGDLVPIGVVRGDSGATEPAPGRDLSVEIGDTVAVLGTADELSSAGLGPSAQDRPLVGARAGRPGQVRRSSLLWAVLRAFDRRVRIALVAMVGLIAVSVTVLMIGYRDADGGRMSPLDALYFTVETVGTVGFGDFYFRDQEWWLRAWAIALMVVGATLLTLLFALLTNALISQRIEAALGRRRLTGLDHHVVCVGLGSVGAATVRRLVELGVECIAVDRDEGSRFLAEVRALGVPTVIADATQPDTWRRLHLERARAVAVLTSADLANIETGLAVRDLLGERWSSVPAVLRVFDRRLAHTVGTSFGFRYVRSPAELAAPWFVGAALGLDVLDTFYVGDEPLLAARLRVGAALDGRAMHQLGLRIRVVSLERADGTAVDRPRRETRLGRGDTAWLVGGYDELLGLLRLGG